MHIHSSLRIAESRALLLDFFSWLDVSLLWIVQSIEVPQQPALHVERVGSVPNFGHLSGEDSCSSLL